MASPISFLSEEDVSFLRRFIQDQTRKHKPHLKRLEEATVPPSSEVLIVKIPSGGIPARVGTLVLSAECEIYQRLEDDTLEGIETTVNVYNLNNCDIPGSIYTVTKKDRFGTWTLGSTVIDCGEIGTGTGTGTGSGTGSGTISDDTSTGTGTEATTGTGTGNTSTGTGTSTSSDSDITVEETDVRCEGGFLNVYKRIITITFSGGSLGKETGSWTYDHAAGRCDGGRVGTGVGGGGDLVVVNVTNVTEITNVQENIFYFNTQNNTLNILVNNIWFIFCTCDTQTGTSTSTSGELWWCMEEPEEEENPVIENIEDCTLCSDGIPDHLTFKIISGCDAATQNQPMVYNSTGPRGAGWYTPVDIFDDQEMYWYFPCTYESADELLHLECIFEGSVVGTSNQVPDSCTPFDSGQFGIVVAPVLTDSPCNENSVIVQIVAE